MKSLIHRLSFFSLAVLLLFTNTAFAQEVTQADTGSEAPLIIYEHTIGRGLTQEFALQDIPSSGNFTDVDNLASNVFIGNENIVVTLYDGPDLTGDSIVLETKGLHNLVELGFNDKASSYEAIFRAAPDSGVTFHEHIHPDFGGWSYGVLAGFSASAPWTPFPNDGLSAVVISNPDVVVVLYEDVDFGGLSLTLDTEGLHDLEALGFNDIVSSFEVRGK